MAITQQEYESMFKTINGMIFTPEATHVEKEVERDGVKSKEIFYEITKTLEDVYKEFLNPKVYEPTEIELLKQQIMDMQNYILQKELQESSK